VRNLFAQFRGFIAVFYKEVLHMRRDSMAIMFALIVPIGEMIILGAAIDTNVRQVKTAIYDQSGILEGTSSVPGSSESREFLDRFRNSDTFRIYKFVHSEKELNEELIAGRARVGIEIPVDFDRDLLAHRSAQIMVMVDGSESSVAGQALNVATAIGLDESLKRMLPASNAPALEVRPKVMFNPDSRSPNFFLPGLIAVMLLMITTMLTAFSVVREKERGTLEQLMVTPIKPLGLMMGKMMPYFALALLELAILLTFMRYLFSVAISGSVILLVLLSLSYLFVNLALGMLISVKANSQAEAMQSSMAILLPSIFLSGYVFPRENMPAIFYGMSHLVPATYMIDTFRGVILRGAGFFQLWENAAVLFVMGVVVLLLAAKQFGKMVV
jgi:drug efflux transport system permease protein